MSTLTPREMRYNRRDAMRAYGRRCAICLEDITGEDECYAKTGICGHTFHAQCIDAHTDAIGLNSPIIKCFNGYLNHVVKRPDMVHCVITDRGMIHILDHAEIIKLIEASETEIQKYEEWISPAGSDCPTCRRKHMFLHRTAGRKGYINLLDVWHDGFVLYPAVQHATRDTDDENMHSGALELAHRTLQRIACNLFTDDESQNTKWIYAREFDGTVKGTYYFCIPLNELRSAEDDKQRAVLRAYLRITDLWLSDLSEVRD